MFVISVKMVLEDDGGFDSDGMVGFVFEGCIDRKILVVVKVCEYGF